MELSSDDGIRVFSNRSFGSFSHSNTNTNTGAVSSTSASTSTNAFPGSGFTLGSSSSQPAPARPKPPNKMQVIEILDSDDDDCIIAPSNTAASGLKRFHTAPATLPTSDDEFPDMRIAGRNKGVVQLPPPPLPRRDDRGLAVGSSAITMNNSKQPAAQDKGKGRALFNPPSDDSDSEDAYDVMQRKGPQVTRKKRPQGNRFDEDSAASSDEEYRGGSKAKDKGKGKAKASPKARKAPRLSLEEKEAAKAAKTAAAQEKKQLTQLNLVSKDRKETYCDLTVHMGGTFFRAPPDPNSDDEKDPSAAAARKKQLALKKKHELDWQQVFDRLEGKLEKCPLSVDMKANDLGCFAGMRWTRLVDRVWDDESKMYLPLDCDPFHVEEDSRLFVMPALELSEHVAQKTLIDHIVTLRSRLPDSGTRTSLFLMITGLQKLHRLMKSSDQAAYTAEVRQALANGGNRGEPIQPKPVGIGAKQPKKEDIDVELMRLQVQTKCFIIHVEKEDEAVEWLHQITMDIGFKPYQRRKNLHLAALGTFDEKVTSGKDLEDTFVKMLSSLKGVTESEARGIVAYYPTMRDLYEGWDKAGGEQAKREMLCGIPKGNNLNGTASNRTIGKAHSETIYKVFNSEDPSMFL